MNKLYLLDKISVAGYHDRNTSDDIKEHLKEAITICETALRNVRRQRIWYLIASLILIIPLIWSMGLDYLMTNFESSIGFNLLRLFITSVWCYTLFMSTIWNSLEKNALKAGCMAMELHLLKLLRKGEGDCLRSNINRQR